MDTNPIPGSTPPVTAPVVETPVPAAAPPVAAPAPDFTPAPLPPAIAPAPAKGNFMSRLFEDVSFTEVGFLILGSAAMFTVIYYYRQRIKKMREEENVTYQKIEEVKANVVSFMGPQYKSF